MQAQPFPQAPQQASKKPGPSLGLSLTLLFAGIVIAVPCAIKGFAPIVRSFTRTPVVTPLDTRMHFSHGTYLVYERGDYAFGSAISPSDVEVTADDGTAVPTGLPKDEEHITRNDSEYQGVVRFDIPSAGDYRVQVTTDAPHAVIITRSLVDAVKGSIGWFAAMSLGGLLFVLGVIFIIVGSVRRGRAQRMAYAYPSGYAQPYAPATPVTPPGWYPDTSTPGQQRWWDGSRWTEHTHPSG
jgi:Protein of unknown function (DUF2510)